MISVAYLNQTAIALLSLAVVGTVFLVWSRRVQRELRISFYRMLARILAEYFNRTLTPLQPYTEPQLEEMLIAGKHFGRIPELRTVRLRVEYAEQSQYRLTLLVYRARQMTSLELSRISWSDLPADVQSSAIHGDVNSGEYILMD